ncbi:MAG: hypothetical protein KGL39_24920 [Patescibacteria group bacterium]|nr:hypothetical protein [Patescibacteria group bacterium]
MADYDDKPKQAPKLVPMFPLDSLTPSSKCPHRRKIRKGSRLVCMICHESGLDGHKALKRHPRTDPAPEPKEKPKKKTRKEQRADRYDASKPLNAKKLADKARLDKLAAKALGLLARI